MNATIDAIVKVIDKVKTVEYPGLKNSIYQTFGACPGITTEINCHTKSTISDNKPILTNLCASFFPRTSPIISVIRKRNGNMNIATEIAVPPIPVEKTFPPKRFAA